MSKKEFRVRRVTRFVVTQYEARKGGASSRPIGEYDHEGPAMLAAQAMAKYCGGTFDAAPTVQNKHKVSKAQWEKWPHQSQETFNWLFELMTRDTRLFLHPKSPAPSEQGMRTMAWNAAWLAADAVRDALKA